MGADIAARQMHRLEKAVKNATSLLVYSSNYGATTLVADFCGDRDLIVVLARSGR